jgi:hypothetical protein
MLPIDTPLLVGSKLIAILHHSCSQELIMVYLVYGWLEHFNVLVQELFFALIAEDSACG